MFLVIHNIDGVLLRSDKCQAILSLLAEIEGFHIIASLDHINAGFSEYHVIVLLRYGTRRVPQLAAFRFTPKTLFEAIPRCIVT